MFWLVCYVLLVVSLLGGAFLWAQRKKSEFKSPLARRKISPTVEFFVKDLPPGFYVSVQFCVGFIIAAIIASECYSYFARG